MIIDCNMHYLPEDLFTNEKILNGVLDCVPRTFGEHAYLGVLPGTINFAVPWGQGHGGDYDLDELFAWMDKICASHQGGQ